MEFLTGLYSEFGVATLVAVAICAVITSAIHGSVGVAGGFLMMAALSQLIGVRAAVPVMSVALVISHFARSLLNFDDVDRRVFFAIMLPAIPLIAVGGYLYAQLPVDLVAFGVAVIILTTIPMRHWARSHKVMGGTRMLNGAGALYGSLAGASIGSAMVLSPFMLGYGLTKEAFVGTMAVISLATNLTRIAVFGGASALSAHDVALGVLVGVIMIPGNWIGRTLLRRMATTTHSRLVDAFALIGGLNFLYLAVWG